MKTVSIDEVVMFLRESLGNEQVDAQAALGQTPNWDSLRHILVIRGLETRFAIRIETRHLLQLTSARKILEFLTETV